MSDPRRKRIDVTSDVSCWRLLFLAPLLAGLITVQSMDPVYSAGYLTAQQSSEDDEDPETGGAPSLLEEPGFDPEDPEEIPPPPSGGPTVEPSTESEPPREAPPFIIPERLYGRWISRDPGFTAAIVPSAEGGAGAIELHTDTRVWTGRYEGRPSEDQVASFTYRPNADEMDEDIPLWARERVEGDLEWSIDLIGKGPDHHPYLELHWHRQKIKWSDAEGTADLVEEGDPLVFRLDSAPIIKMTQPAPIFVRAVPYSGLEAKPTGPLSSVLQQQKFRIEVVGPFRLLKTLGQSITVTFEGAESGQKASLQLGATVPEGKIGEQVIYRNQTPIHLSGACNAESRYYPPILTPDWFYALEGEGACVDFDGVDGEVLTVSFGKAKYRFQWWETWMSAAVAAHRDEIERRRVAYNALVSDRNRPPEVRGAATKKLRMINNYDALLRSDRLQIQHKVAIGDMYLGGEGPGAYIYQIGPLYGELVSYDKGILSYTDKDWQLLGRRTVRWMSYSPGLYAESLDFYSNLFSSLFGWMSENYWFDPAYGKSATEAIPTPFDASFPDKDVDPVLKREIAWTHRLEQVAVSNAVAKVSSGMINDLSESFFKQGMMLVYDEVAEESGAGFLWIVADWLAENAGPIMTGLEDGKWPALSSARNHRGQPLDGWGIAQSGSMFLLNFAVDIDRAVDFYSTSRFYSKGLGKGDTALRKASWRTVAATVDDAEALVTVSRRAIGAGVDLVDGHILPNDLPSSVKEGVQTDALSVDFKAAPMVPQRPVDVTPVTSGGAARSTSAGGGVPPRDSIVTGPSQVELVAPFTRSQKARGGVRSAGTSADGQSTRVPLNPADEYGPDVTATQRYGAVTAPQFAEHSDGLISAQYVASDGAMSPRAELTGAAQMQDILADAYGRGEIPAAAIHSLGHQAPYPDAYLNQWFAAQGYQVADFRGNNRAATLAHANLAQARGWKVIARVDGGSGVPRQVVIEDIILDARGTPTMVAVFDPKYGTRLDVPAAQFDGLLMRNSDGPVFKAVRRTDPGVDAEDLTGTRQAPRAPGPDGGPDGGQVKRPPPAPDVDDLTDTVAGPRTERRYAEIEVADVEAVQMPEPGSIWEFKDINGKDAHAAVKEMLGKPGSFNRAYRSASDPNTVIRTTNPDMVLPGKRRQMVQAQITEDIGREALSGPGVDHTKVQGVPVFSTVMRSDGGRVETVGFARGQSPHEMGKARGEAALTPEEAVALNDFDLNRQKTGRRFDPTSDPKGFAAQKKYNQAYSMAADEAKAVAEAIHEINRQGYVALDIHNVNFHLARAEDGKVNVIIVDPGGMMPIKGRDPAIARRIQAMILAPTDDFKALYRELGPTRKGGGISLGNMFNLYVPYQDAVMKELMPHLDLADLERGIGSFDFQFFEFKPSLGLENPEILPFFRQLGAN